VSFNLNGGSGNQPNNVTATYGAAMPALSTSANPTRTGHTFGGWYDAPSGGFQYYNTSRASVRTWDKTGTTVTLYAHWTPIGYTITYKAGTGGSGSDQTQSVTFADTFTTKAANTFTKANATFAGWSASSGSYPNANTSYTYNTAGNITLTATWNCNAGYTLNSSTGACVQCAAGTYKSSAGNGACSACNALTGVSPSGGTYTSVAGSTSSTACKYTAPAKTIAGCSTVTSNQVTYTGSAWPASTYNVKADGGYVIANNNTKDATCDQCSGAVWSAGGTATSCSPCPAQTDGWTRNGGTGWTAVTQCNQTKTPANCASGTIKQNATSTTAWGTSSVLSPLTANQNYYVNGTSCSACSSLGGGLYKNSAAGNSGGSGVCKTDSISGKYLAKATDTATTNCGPGKYKAAHTLAYPNTSSCATADAGYFAAGNNSTAQTKCVAGSYSGAGASACTACGAGKTSAAGATAASACTSCTAITNLSTWATSTWNTNNTMTNLCAVDKCAANSYKSGNTCPTCSSGTSSKYSKSAVGTTSVNSCYLTTTAGKYVATAKEGEVDCPANSYCVGGSTIYYGTGATTGGSATCSSGTGNKYTKSAAKSSKVGQCYLTLTSGKQVASAGAGVTDCTAGRYCTSTGNIYYNTDGGTATYTGGQCVVGSYSGAGASACTACGAGKTSAAGATAASACTSCTAITNLSTWATSTWNTNNTMSNLCTVGTCNGASYKSGNTCPTCPAGYGANTSTGKTAISQCQAQCAAGYAVQTANEACKIVPSGYQTGTHKVAYGSKTPTAADSTSPAAGTWYSCLTNYSASGTAATNHDARSDCTISCGVGTQIASANATQCTTPAGNWYIGAHTVAAGSKSAPTSCKTGYTISGTTAADHDGETDCKISCEAGKYIATAGAGCAVCPAGKYCLGGSKNQTETLAVSGSCPAGTYSTGGAKTSACTSALSGYTAAVCATDKYSGTGAGSCEDCATAKGYHNSGAVAANHAGIASCKATCSGTQYVATKGAGCVTVDTGYYGREGNTQVAQDATLGRTQCPEGYRNGAATTIEGNCVMNVAGGKYVATPKEKAASGTCEKGYAKAAHTVKYGDTSSCAACTGTTYAESTGMSACTKCPTATNATDVVSYGYWESGGVHTTRRACQAIFKAKTLSHGSIAASGYYCYIDKDSDSYGLQATTDSYYGCYSQVASTKCSGGYYTPKYTSSSLTQMRYTSIADMEANLCTAVGAGYWSAADSLTRTQCATGLTTIGYGAGADEAGDCGRVMHIGDSKLYLRGTKKTTPSLNVKVGDKTFYGNMSTATKGKLRVKSGSTTYSVHDDSM